MTGENHQHRKISTGMSRRDLLRAGVWGTVGWAGWSVGTGSRTLTISPAPAHAGEQPRAGGTLAMWTQGDPPNFDLHQNSAFVVNWPMAPWVTPSGIFTRALGVSLAEWAVPLPAGAAIRPATPATLEAIERELVELFGAGAPGEA